MGKTTNKRLSVTLAVLLMASAFTACSGGNSSAPSSSAASSAAGSTAPSQAASSSAPSSQAAESGEPAEVSVLYIGDDAFEQKKGLAILEEKTNTDLVFTYLGSDTAKEKFNIMVQSESLPDLVHDGGKYVTRSELYRLGREEVFIPLNDLIASDGPNLQAVFAEHPDYLEAATAPDGNVYALPSYYYGLGQEVRSHVFIETNFLKNLNMEMPETVDELYHFLKAVKEQDANGNGDPNDEIPYISWVSDDASSVFQSAIMGAFTKVSVSENRVVDNGKVTFSPATDGYREGLRFLAKLYAEGLLYSESFSLERKTIWTLAENDPDVNTIAMSNGHHAHILCNWDSMRWQDYEAVGALAGPDGKKGTLPQNPGMNVGVSMMISSTCKNPQAAMRVCDYMASEEGAKLAYWGVEDYDWWQPSPGAVNANGDPATYRPISDEEKPEDYKSGNLGNGWSVYQTYELNSPEVDLSLGWQSYGDKFTSKYYETLYADDLLPANEFWPGTLYYDEEALEEMALLQADLDNSVRLAQAEFVMGTRSVDTDWDAYIQELTQNGLERYLEISQQQYDLNQK